ncbi:MAG: quinone reductase [Solirubrobacterales bacterium]|jgi:NADPH2:quinone reductase|nr:quinone reductase [Solirubrobacterales bacterium]
MRAAVVTRFGDPDVFEVREMPDPIPGPGQVSIDVTHAAVGLIDVFIRQGLYKDREGLPQPPYVPGLEVAGIIRELGEGVDSFNVGEPVVTLSGTGAEDGYASISVVDARLAASLDGSGVDPALAVAALPNAATAYLALTRVAHLQQGETVLVHGALGGLASTFPGVARTLGASKVVGTVRPTSLATAKTSGLPYDRVIASDEFRDALIDERFDVVIDPVGGDLRTASLDVMAPLGRLLAVGNASGDWQHSAETNRLWSSNLAILGFNVGFYLPTHLELARAAAEGALKAVSEGLIDLHTDSLPLENAGEAHRRIEAGQVNGRILLVP